MDGSACEGTSTLPRVAVQRAGVGSAGRPDPHGRPTVARSDPRVRPGRRRGADVGDRDRPSRVSQRSSRRDGSDPFHQPGAPPDLPGTARSTGVRPGTLPCPLAPRVRRSLRDTGRGRSPSSPSTPAPGGATDDRAQGPRPPAVVTSPAPGAGRTHAPSPRGVCPVFPDTGVPLAVGRNDSTDHLMVGRSRGRGTPALQRANIHTLSLLSHIRRFAPFS